MFILDLQYFAHKKTGGVASTNCNHDSNSKRRGVKRSDGQMVKAGEILIRQLGSKYLIGENVYQSKDYTIHAKKNGLVHYYQKKIKHRFRTFVEIKVKMENLE